MADPDLTERLAAVLAEHADCESRIDSPTIYWACGITTTTKIESWADARHAHVAAALAPLVQEACDTAAADALSEAADAALYEDRPIDEAIWWSERIRDRADRLRTDGNQP